MDTNFETQKNVKALGITVGICIMLALMLFFISWTLPQVQPPVVDEGIEVNLGNSDEGLGDIAPEVPGDPALEAAPQAEPTPTPPAEAEAPNDTKLEEDNNEADATPVNTTPKPSVKPKPTKTVTTKAPPKPVTKPAVVATPKPAKPKALYGGGTAKGTGGNNADSYNGVRNQGIAGGNGDQGKPNGNPNSDSYTGNGGTGKSGVSIRSGLTGRRFKSLPKFEDDFNENAKVAVDIVVNKDGKVMSANINPKGTTTVNSNIRNIARQKALQLKLNESSAETQSGTIVFDFKLKG